MYATWFGECLMEIKKGAAFIAATGNWEEP
jgi:hypothetical protein